MGVVNKDIDNTMIFEKSLKNMVENYLGFFFMKRLRDKSRLNSS
jgi:hypothetical protein